jgi:hypothetical protein
VQSTRFKTSLLLLTLLATTLCLAAAGTAHAALHTVSASACDVTSSSSANASRSAGISNSSKDKLTITCPVPQGSAMVSGYQVYGWTVAGAGIYCQLRHLRKEDGSLLHMFTFTLSGVTPVYLNVPNGVQTESGVGELLCELPSTGKGRLTAIEAYTSL